MATLATLPPLSLTSTSSASMASRLSSHRESAGTPLSTASRPPPSSMPTSPSVSVDVPNVGQQVALTIHNHGQDASSPHAHPHQHRPSLDPPEKPSYLQKQLSAGFDTAFFEFNDASSLTQYFIATAVAKAHSAVWPRFVSGLLSGLFVVIGAVFALVAAGGISAATRAASPAIPHILSGLTFPIALILIMFVGGDLFTGNCMYTLLGFFTGRITLRQMVSVLLVSFFSNLCGCLFFVYFLGYQSDLFVAEPYNSWMLAVADGKVGLSWGVVVLRAIGANILVCIGIFMGCSSRDALGRFVIAWIPVLTFSIIGYEHVVANMAFIPIALMYGGTTFSTAQYIGRSMVPAALGNIIGGGILLGGFLAYLYGARRQATLGEWLRYHLVPSQPLTAILAETWHQLTHDLPIKEREEGYEAGKSAAGR